MEAHQSHAALKLGPKSAQMEPVEGLTVPGTGWLHRGHRCCSVAGAVLGLAQVTAEPVPWIQSYGHPFTHGKPPQGGWQGA